MPANFTRRLDLFRDAGFEDPDAVVNELQDYAKSLNDLTGSEEIRKAVAALAKRSPASNDVHGLLPKATEFLFQRNGDLSNLLWLLRTLSGGEPQLGNFVIQLVHQMFETGRVPEALCLLRFLIEGDFDYGDLYHQQNISYGFFQQRDPNPLVWKVHHMIRDRRPGPLYIVELGCGIGNDGLGLISAPHTRSYTGVDLSEKALEVHGERASKVLRKDQTHHLIAGDFVETLPQLADKAAKVNLIYSYSSLHYFNSSEMATVFRLVRDLLVPGDGLFCFGVKGAASIWDGQGVPLYRPDVWINHDGQSRWFPSDSALDWMVDGLGFEMLLHERHEHWGYSVQGQPDRFHYVICTPRLRS